MHIENSQEIETEEQPMRLRLPFLTEPIGIGTAVQRLTEAVRVKPCGGCRKRKEALDRAVEFVPMGWT